MTTSLYSTHFALTVNSTVGQSHVGKSTNTQSATLMDSWEQSALLSSGRIKTGAAVAAIQRITRTSTLAVVFFLLLLFQIVQQHALQHKRKQGTTRQVEIPGSAPEGGGRHTILHPAVMQQKPSAKVCMCPSPHLCTRQHTAHTAAGTDSQGPLHPRIGQSALAAVI